MICGGDEIGRTQGGNNNAYCQDNEISWFDWDLDGRRRGLLNFTQRLITLRREHPNLRRRKFFQDRSIRPSGARGTEVRGRHVQDITWLRPDGEQMTEDEWQAGWVRCFGIRLSGKLLDHVDSLGQTITDDTFLIMANPHWEPIKFYLPKNTGEASWRLLLDTRTPDGVDPLVIQAGDAYELIPRSTAVFCELETE
jgi:glycogen operon protein